MRTSKGRKWPALRAHRALIGAVQGRRRWGGRRRWPDRQAPLIERGGREGAGLAQGAHRRIELRENLAEWEKKRKWAEEWEFWPEKVFWILIDFQISEMTRIQIGF